MNNTAIKMRDVVVDLIKGIVDRERPKARVAMVYSYNRFNRKAEIVLAGETEPGISARFPKHLQPSKALNTDLDKDGNPIGDIVLIEGYTNNYRITQIIEGDAMGQGWKIGDLEIWGGAFMNERHGKYFGLSTTLPPEGESIGLGRWVNPDAQFYNHGACFVELIVHQPFFAYGRKEYRFPITSYDTAGVWQNLYPDKDGGVEIGHQFEVEIKSDGDGFDLRIRNVQQHDSLTPSGYIYNMWIWGENFTHDATNFNVVDAAAAPTVAFRTDLTEATEVNGSVQQGPFFDSIRHTAQNRLVQNLLGGGTVTWDGRFIKWSADLIAPAGVTRLLTGGKLNIPMPAAASTVYDHGITGQTTTAVAAGGIDMRPGGSINYSVLYYEPNLGTSSGNAGKYHVVGTDTSFHVPSHWIYLAAMDAASGYLSFATDSLISIDPSSWYQTGWGDLDATNYGPARAWYDPVKKWIEVEIYLQRTGANTATATIHSPVVVASAYRPTYRVNLVVANNIGGTEAMNRLTMLRAGEASAGRMDIVFGTTRVWTTGQLAFIKGGWKVP